MDTIFINSENSKTSDSHRLLLNLLDKIKNDEKCFFISPQKLFSFSRYLSFYLDFLVM